VHSEAIGRITAVDRLERRFSSPPRIEPSLRESLGRTIDLAQRIAKDELRLLQLESQERVQGAATRAVLLAVGALCLVSAWVGASGAAVVALADFFPLEIRLALLASVQLALGAVLLWSGLRRRGDR
jgi:hypothetical protein